MDVKWRKIFLFFFILKERERFVNLHTCLVFLEGGVLNNEIL